MLDLIGTLEGMAEYLRDRGVAATTDPASLNTPGVWVTCERVECDRLDGGGTMRVNLFLIVADNPNALTGLQDLLGRVLDLVDAHDTITTETIVLPGDATALPAFKVPHDADINTIERTVQQ